MAEKSATAAKAAHETGPQAGRREAPPPAALGLTAAILDLQRTAGNRKVERLLSERRRQPGLVRPPDAARERTAERFAGAAWRRPAAGGDVLLQRKCRCQEGEEELVQAEADSGPTPPAAALADGAEAPEPEAQEPETPAPEEPVPETPAAEGEPAAALVVDDDAGTLGPGQMTKGEFFTRLRAEVCAAAEAGLAGTGHSARGCPLIEHWLGYYERQDVARINRDLPRFAGEGPRPASAEESIHLIASRVRASVATWARTGEITGVPRGIPLPGMGLPGLGSLGGLLGGLGGVLFKARPGGARDPGDPAALQARLGDGRPLDGAARSRMEAVFGRGFSHVRVHTDSGAAGLAASLNAKAFTVGEHVAFGAREYRPGTLAGDALLAHELAHVAQQGAGGAAAAAGGYDRLERDADLAGASAVATLWGGMRSLPRPGPRLRSGLRLQRCGGCGRKAATTPPAAGPPPACEPAPASLQTVMAAARLQNETVLGFTQIDLAASTLDCIPEFAAGAAPGTCAFTPKRPHLELISRYVRPGKYPHPQNRTQPVKGCGDVPIVLEVTDDIAELAKKGEQEHCRDIRIAFERTVVPCANAVAGLAGTALTGNSGEECLADLSRKLGFNPRNCSQEFNRLQLLTGQRDVGEWHTFEPYRVSADCQELVYRYRRGKKNRIDDKAVAPEAHIPAATQCAGPAAAPAAPAAPATPPAPAQSP